MARVVIAALVAAAWFAAAVPVGVAQTAPPSAPPAPPRAPGVAPGARTAPGTPAAVKPGTAPAAPAPAPAPSRKYFRFVDRNGVVNYTDVPPQGDLAAPAAPGAAEPTEPARTSVADPKVERERLAKVDELLGLVGLRRKLDETGKATRTVQLPPNAPPKFREQIPRILSAAFEPSVTYPIVRDAFHARVDEAALGQALAFFRGPLARRLTRLEAETSIEKTQADILAFAEKIRREPLPEARVALADRLDLDVGMTEMQLDAATAMMGILQRVLVPMLPIDKRPPPADLDRAMQRLRSPMRETVKRTSLFTLLYAYRGVTDADLQQYIDFLETDAGRWYARTAREAMLSMTTAVMEGIVRQTAAMAAGTR